MYVQWDGKLTRPCIRGPQNLGSIENENVLDFWNGPSFEGIRTAVRDAKDLNVACGSCFNDRRRLIDHLTPFGDNIGGYDYDKMDNYFHALGEHESGHSTIGSKPVVLVLDLSAKCQIRCPKCFVYNSAKIQTGEYQLGHMSMATFQKFVALLSTALLVIGHENGESMLNKNFMEMVKIIKENKCRFLFNTTGLLLTPEKSKNLVEYGVEQIMFSIDSIDEGLYEQMHKGGTLSKLMDNLHGLNDAKRNAKSLFPQIGWYFVASKSNIREIPAIIERASELNFNSLYITHLNQPTQEQGRSYFDYYRKESMMRSEEDKSFLQTALSEARTMAAERNLKFYF